MEETKSYDSILKNIVDSAVNIQDGEPQTQSLKKVMGFMISMFSMTSGLGLALNTDLDKEKIAILKAIVSKEEELTIEDIKILTEQSIFLLKKIPGLPIDEKQSDEIIKKLHSLESK